MQQHAASFIARTEASTGAELPRFIKDEFDAFLECGILAHGFLRLRCGECGHDELLGFSSKRSGIGIDKTHCRTGTAFVPGFFVLSDAYLAYEAAAAAGGFGT